MFADRGADKQLLGVLLGYVSVIQGHIKQSYGRYVQYNSSKQGNVPIRKHFESYVSEKTVRKLENLLKR